MRFPMGNLWTPNLRDDDWFRAFVHEGGHAIIATMGTIRCYGVFLMQKPKLKACILVDPLASPLELSDNQRLYLAAGNAAEKVVLGKADSAGSGEDRRIFGQPPGVTFEEKVEEARTLLLDKKSLVEGLALRLYKMYQNARGDFSGFRVQEAGVDSNITAYWVLLDEAELKDLLTNVGPGQ